MACSKRKGLRSELPSLARKLKELCDVSGKETNISKSSEVLNELGIYFMEKSPHKLSLIRSAALLNSAIIRQPDNLKFKKDLECLCQHVLRTANADNQKEDLVQFSNDVLAKISLMRQAVNERLHFINKLRKSKTASDRNENNFETRITEEIKNLNIYIYEEYTQIMAYVSKKCELIMGEPPCKYALVGMGSLARKEITPYSDFENAIVLEDEVQSRKDYDKLLDYFRWLSVIFQIILVNLKETILRFLEIPHLNDKTVPGGDWFYDAFTKCGISPDGFAPHASKSPLGRTEKTKDKNWTTELIKPISKMILYLKHEEDLKNGYHLADILTKTCFVYGNQEIFEKFVEKVEITLKENPGKDNILKQLVDDMDNFDPLIHSQNFQAVTTCDIKRVLYRSTTLYIAALGRLLSVNRTSCFEIIEDLHRKRKINERTAQKLSLAVATACLVRLQIYMKKEGQDDVVGEQGAYDVEDNTITKTVIDIVGAEDIVDYFVTAFQLQTLIRGSENVRSFDSHFEWETLQLQFSVMCNLKMYEIFFKKWEDLQKNKPASLLQEDFFKIKLRVASMHFQLHEYDECLKVLRWLNKQTIRNNVLQVAIQVDITWCLYDMGQYENVIKYIEQIIENIEGFKHLSPSINHDLSDLHHIYGKSKYELQEFEPALMAHKKEMICLLEKRGNHPTKVLQANFMAMCHNNIGFCLVALDENESAIGHATQALDLKEKNRVPKSVICASYKLLGCSYYQERKFKKALEYFQLELDMRLKYTPLDEQETDEDLFQCIHNVEALTEACRISNSGGDVIPESMPRE